MNIVVSCEHASNALPECYGTLGVTQAVLQSHVAWDPGAADIARGLAQQLGVPCELGRYSRILVDLNRSADNPSVIPEVAFGVPVPGNRHLSPAERRHRLETYHAPYWQAVTAHLKGGENLHLSIHSFTPEIEPEKRQFSLGLLFKTEAARENAIALQLASALRQQGYTVEYNEPYPGSMDLITTALRKRIPGYVGIEIEINQSLRTGEWQRPLREALQAGVRTLQLT